MNAADIEKKFIIDALESWEYVFADMICCEKEDRENFEKDYGIPADIGLMVLRGIIKEWTLGHEGAHHGHRLIEKILERVGVRAAEIATRAMADIVTVEHVSVEDTRRRTVTRAVTAASTPDLPESIGDSDGYDLAELRQRLDQGEYLHSEERIALQWKRCTKCDTSKPFGDFSNQTSAADGKQSWCKTCTNNAPAERRVLPKSSTPAPKEHRAGTVKCNQCEEWLSPKDIRAHKLTEHSIQKEIPSAQG